MVIWELSTAQVRQRFCGRCRSSGRKSPLPSLLLYKGQVVVEGSSPPADEHRLNPCVRSSERRTDLFRCYSPRMKAELTASCPWVDNQLPQGVNSFLRLLK